MKTTAVLQFTKDPEGMRLFQQERLLFQITERICEIMKKTGVTRSELAKRLAKTKGRISQILNGDANPNLRTIADLFTALGETMTVSSERMFVQEEDRQRGRFVTQCFESTWREPQQWEMETLGHGDPENSGSLAG